MEEYLNFSVGSHLRHCNIKDINKVPVKIPVKSSDGEEEFTDAEKICFTVSDRNNKEFQISDVWVKKDEEPIIRGLWFTLSEEDKLSPSSSIAVLLSYYEVETLGEMIGKQVKVFPDDKNYLVIVACDHESIN